MTGNATWRIFDVAIIRTLALNGAPIMLLEMEGVPPLPMAVDDEYISEESYFPQPLGKRSYMTGFVIVTQIFRLLGQCLQGIACSYAKRIKVLTPKAHYGGLNRHWRSWKP